MLANWEAILAARDSLEKILDEDTRRLAQKARKEADEKRFAHAREKMGPGEDEIIMYGQTFWPVIDNRIGVYDYATLCLAMWQCEGGVGGVSMSRAGESVAPKSSCSG